MGGKYSEHSIQEFQVRHIINTAKLRLPQCFNDVKEDFGNGWMKEKAVVPLSRSAAGAVIQATWRLILIELGVGINIIKLNSRIPTEIFAANKGFPSIGWAPAMLPQRRSRIKVHGLV